MTALKYGARKRLVLKLLTDDPEITNEQIKEFVPGIGDQYIYLLRDTHGYPRTGLSRGLAAQNYRWIINEAKRRKIGPTFIIDALISDVRKTTQKKHSNV